MTVCIACVCNVGPDRPTYVVTASDRMITIGDIEYEPDQTKTVELGSSTLGLLAGDMQVHAAIVPRTMARLKDLVKDRTPHRLAVEEIADAYAKEFAYYRRALAEREILMPRGWDFERFARLQAILPHYQVQEIDARLVAHSLNAEAIIAGLDHTGAHIYKMRDPGVAESFDTPFFACIGSGRDIATTQFMLAKYEKQWSVTRALWLTFSAKARAEAAGGVGPKTDVVLVGPDGITHAGEDQKRALYVLFREVILKETAAQEAAASTLAGYIAARTAGYAAGADSTQSPTPQGAGEQAPRDASLSETSPPTSSVTLSRARRRRSGPKSA